MPWAQTLRDLSPHLSFHTSACALVSACCSFLLSFSQCVSPGTQDSPTCPALPLTHMSVCIHINTRNMHTEDKYVQLHSLLQSLMLLSALPVPNNSACSQPSAEVSVAGASKICTPSLLETEDCGGASLKPTKSDLIATLAFCQQRLHSDESARGVPSRQIEYVQDGTELCLSCQKQA